MAYGVTIRPTPATRIDNVQLAGGSTTYKLLYIYGFITVTPFIYEYSVQSSIISTVHVYIYTYIILESALDSRATRLVNDSFTRGNS